MKALFLQTIGNLSLSEAEKPLPRPDELLVRIEASGICGTDRHLFKGEFPCQPPVTLGHEFAGIIEAVGSEVRDFKPGMRVTGDPNIFCGRCPECHRGRVQLCQNLTAIGIHRNGGFAQYVALPEKQAVELPLTLDPLWGAFCEPLACCLHGVHLADHDHGGAALCWRDARHAGSRRGARKTRPIRDRASTAIRRPAFPAERHIGQIRHCGECRWRSGSDRAGHGRGGIQGNGRKKFGSPVTRMPGLKSLTSLPTTSMIPANSWPSVTGGWQGNSPLKRCLSVPQIPAARCEPRVRPGGAGVSSASDRDRLPIVCRNKVFISALLIAVARPDNAPSSHADG